MSRVASSQLGLQSGHPFTPSGCYALGSGYLWMISTVAQSIDVLQCPWVDWWDASIYTLDWWHGDGHHQVPPDTQPYYIPTWLPVLPHRLAYHWTDWEPTKSNVQLLSCWQNFYVHGVVMACEFFLCVGVSCWTHLGQVKLISMAWCGCAVSPVH